MGTHPIFESDFDCLTDKKCLTHTLAATCLTDHLVAIRHILQISKDFPRHKVATLNKEHHRWEVVIQHQEETRMVAITLMAVDMVHRPPRTPHTPGAVFLHHTLHLEDMEGPWEDTVVIMAITSHTKLTSITGIDEAPRHPLHHLAPRTTAGNILTSTSVND